jgi:acyl carrier protein
MDLLGRPVNKYNLGCINMKNRQEMLEILGEAMEINSANITEETVLENLGDAWDSVAILSVISIIDSYAQKSIPVNAIVESKTIKDLIDLVYKNDNKVISCQ